MVCWARSRVRAWQTVTVASFCNSINAIGLPTMFDAPTTTAFLPATSTPVVSSSNSTPYGVHGGKMVLPTTSPPTLYK